MIILMEKQFNDLTIFEEYRNRQVVLNYYQDDDFLWKRDCFHFESIQVDIRKLIFFKKNGIIVEIPLMEYTSAVINNDFQNYYIFKNGTDRLEIYFPH
ncbi:hypothetical protein [Neobacillus kokaensis]|uniref:Uncharacterized protein n=1 Tax=Neobacillus kokaensis TaxID=2759023 RepID=A0ABQ3MW42_9BACI|nr:hypothetical protein [Neobacillus kokaensis]GHH96893.1 hypothetical protein AM1BK_04360 [Neobacillus kokaensis]